MLWTFWNIFWSFLLSPFGTLVGDVTSSGALIFVSWWVGLPHLISQVGSTSFGASE